MVVPHPWHDNGTENRFHSWMWKHGGPKASPLPYEEKDGYQ